MFRKIVLATDFSDAARVAERVAVDLARGEGAELVFVHVHEELPQYTFSESTMVDIQRLEIERQDQAREALAGRVDEAGAAGVKARGLVRTGRPAEEIVEAAREEGADLVVVGTHGRSGLDRLIMGSVAERVVRQAACPVLVARGDGAARSAKAA